MHPLAPDGSIGWHYATVIPKRIQFWLNRERRISDQPKRQHSKRVELVRKARSRSRADMAVVGAVEQPLTVTALITLGGRLVIGLGLFLGLGYGDVDDPFDSLRQIDDLFHRHVMQ